MMTGAEARIEEIGRALKAKDNFLITAHVNPDGDTIGTQLALYECLKAMGKKVEIINRDPVPSIYEFLPNSDKIVIGEKAWGGHDTVILLECGIIERSGLEGIEPASFKINIDHHPGNKEYADINWVDLDAAAVGLMVYHLVRALPVEINSPIATDLYTAIITDTGSFQFSNTSSQSLKAAAELAEYDINPTGIAQHCFENQPFRKMKLLGYALSTLDRDETGQVAWMRMTYDTFRDLNAANEDTDGLVNYPRAVKEVKIALFFKEKEKGIHRVSMRSRGDVDVSVLADYFNGGGHKHASGCTLEGDFEHVRDRILKKIKKDFLD